MDTDIHGVELIQDLRYKNQSLKFLAESWMLIAFLFVIPVCDQSGYGIVLKI